MENMRRLYAGTVHVMVLYGASIWAEKVVATRRLRDSLQQLQRRVTNRICRAYRTVSWTAVGVLSGVPPIEVLARMYSDVYHRVRELQRARVQVTVFGVRWGDRLDASSSIDGRACWKTPAWPARGRSRLSALIWSVGWIVRGAGCHIG